MKADPDAQRRLLDLQAIDTALAQLAHRRASLPELAELDRLARELSALEDERVRAQVGRRRHRPRHRPAGEGRRAGPGPGRPATAARLDAGTGPAQELEALQHELATLTRRQGELEDAELELMEQREQAQAELDGVDGDAGRHPADRAETEAAPRHALSRSGQGPRLADRLAGRRWSPTCRPT